jgi:hypothetical protein
MQIAVRRHVDGQALTPIEQIEPEEPASAANEGATMIWHGQA